MMEPRLHVQGLGSGERVVVLLHGLFGLSANLGSLARELARDYQVILPDLRNHGRSFHDPRMSYPLMAEDIVRLLDARHIGSAALLGHSMGGKVAMQLALQYPERVERVLVADIAPVRYEPHHTRLLAALRQLQADELADRKKTQQLLEQQLGDAGVTALMLMNRTRAEDGSWHWRFNLDAIEDCYADILAAPVAAAPYEGPVLFLKGELSEYIDSSQRELTRALFPQARMKIVAGAGHWLHAEKPQVFLRLCRDFLAAAG